MDQCYFAMGKIGLSSQGLPLSGLARQEFNWNTLWKDPAI